MSTDSTPNRILHVVSGADGFHLVSASTLAEAAEAQAAVDNGEIDPNDDAYFEDAYTHTIETGMLYDVPADVLREFAVVQSPMFSDEIAYVEPDRLEDMIAALKALGFTVIPEDD